MINETQLNIVRNELGVGIPLDLTMLGRIFGDEFWQLIILAISGHNIEAEKIIINILPKEA